MSRRINSVLLFALSLVTAVAAQSRPTYTVSTAKEFLQRLGSDRTIVLKKGDYRLSSVYEMTGPGFEWFEGEDGKELTLTGLDNLVIRGADGARIVTDSLKSYLVGFYDCSKVEIENVTFARDSGGEDFPEAGLFYAETTQNITLTRVSLEGPSSLPLEIWECDSVVINDSTVQGGLDGAVNVGRTGNFSFSRGEIKGNSGYPLIYIEESGTVSFDGIEFSDNSGGNVVENWGGEGEAGSVVFTDCEFKNDDFEYFAEGDTLPVTDNCRFSGSSFDANWAESSVSYGGSDGGEAWTEHWVDETSGLGFDYFSDWELSEDLEPEMTILYSPSSDQVAVFAKVLDITNTYNLSRDGARLLRGASDSLVKLIKDQAGLDLQARQTLALAEWEDWHMAEFGGTASTGDGAVASVRYRLFLMPEGVWAFLVLSDDENAVREGGDLDLMLKSLTGSDIGT